LCRHYHLGHVDNLCFSTASVLFPASTHLRFTDLRRAPCPFLRSLAPTTAPVFNRLVCFLQSLTTPTTPLNSSDISTMSSATPSYDGDRPFIPSSRQSLSGSVNDSRYSTPQTPTGRPALPRPLTMKIDEDSRYRAVSTNNNKVV
jgi:hypothetical protein